MKCKQHFPKEEEMVEVVGNNRIVVVEAYINVEHPTHFVSLR